ncbi:two-component system, NtrC family, nitrogen regulation sensor histidine kinase NtrY [Enhydrobacter aerosaccus]|uniref:histidine kinase n=1 Tax=Enhydrobacter aerosaccus TaxID=225324 RepID=A0A1T4L1D9_9HYPH|nr:ATP-binding protein [Enhydrobacter aerosaccus]SJZ48525.1 two-component system, NtrC family, nitrogen regulation sensor histidine kinase NtrY [Enhydrobacter aerosaccus]
MNAIGRALTGRVAAISLATIAIAAGTATYGWLAGFAPASFSTTGWMTGLLVADLVVATALVAVLAGRLTQLWLDRRRGAAGSRLHMRLVLVCSVFTVTPTLVVTIILSLLVINLTDFVVKPSQAAYETARAIGEPVRRAREDEILRDIAAISAPLQALGIDALRDGASTSRTLAQLIEGRAIIEADVIDADKGLIARATAPDATPIANPVPAAKYLWQAVNQARPVQFESERGAYFVMQLFLDQPLFLVTGHAVDLRVVDYIKSIEFAGKFYAQIEQALRRSQLILFVVCGAIALLMLLAAVWLAIQVATRLTAPIGGLMAAAEKVRVGDLGARVEEGPPNDELGQLARSFNRMTSQIEQQRSELVAANQELDRRRRLTDAVLAGVSAGILSVDGIGVVTRTNRSALDLLALPEDGVLGRQLIDIMPEIAPLVAQAAERPDRLTQGQIEILQRGTRRILLVRISAASDSGSVVTFDDVTDLMSAQRMAAWGDVARRIAHEIKNPLTPIQLSAERLRRRYLKQIKEDPETFSTCTDTIIRQVGDIGRMVDEFSSFARMPRPTVQPEDAKELCQQALFLQRSGNAGIVYQADLPEHAVPLICDRRQVGQVLTNILKNAAEAIEGRTAGPGEVLPRGAISLALKDEGTTVRIVVEDNGKGLPKEGRDRLTEPYMTTRSKGTGLGLAIVKKIMEDHGGLLLLEDRESGGARISLVFRRDAKEIASVSSQATAAQ